WEPKVYLEGWLAVESPRQTKRRSWLLFGAGDPLGEELAKLLEERGDRVVFVRPGNGDFDFHGRCAVLRPGDPDAVRRLLDVAATADDPPLYGVVHLWSLDATGDTTLSSLPEEQDRGCISALHVVQALAAREWAEPPRLWLVTRGAQPVGDGAAVASVAQSPLWGLGKVIALEHPERWCVRVDLDPVSHPGESR